MPADVFAENEKFSMLRKDGGGVNAAGGVEVGLGRSHEVGGVLDQLGIDGALLGKWGVALKDSIDRGFSTETAGGGGEKMAGESLPVASVVLDEEDEGMVITGVEVDPADLFSSFNDALGEEEAHDQEFIITWGAHEHGEGAAVDDDLEGLFDGDLIA